jgi:hypothetical protein
MPSQIHRARRAAAADDPIAQGRDLSDSRLASSERAPVIEWVWRKAAIVPYDVRKY